MAKIRLGALAGSVSGSIGCYTFSHNRGGPYVRLRAKPIQPLTFWTNDTKTKFTTLSQLWFYVTAPDKLAWKTWCAVNPITDVLGDAQVLQPNAAFIGLNRRAQAAGGSGSTTPPVSPAPSAIQGAACTTDIGSLPFEITFTDSPRAATEALWILCALVTSPSITYVKNYLKFVCCSSVPATSAVNILAEMTTRFGTLSAGQICHFRVSVCDNATGLLSPPVHLTSTITNTP
jgi:hypothetical protein